MPKLFRAFGLGKPAPETAAPIWIRVMLSTSWRALNGDRGVGEWSRATITDLGLAGVTLVTDRPIPRGLPLELKFALGSGEAAVRYPAEVLDELAEPPAGRRRYAIRFTDLLPADETAIGEYINRRETERRTRDET